MLALLPTGIQDAFRRRNSTTMDQFTDRRGSISVYDNYCLPSSKADMRRFSSYEQLAPFFQQILSQDNVPAKPLPPAPAPTLAQPTSPSSANNAAPIVPSPLVRARRGSISKFASALTGSFRRQRSAPAKPISQSESEVSCDDLDAQIARIKEQLAQFKSEDTDMSQRVDDLSSSVEELCVHNAHSALNSPSSISSQDHLYYRLRQEKMLRSQCRRHSVSVSGLQSISESAIDSEEEEDGENDSIATGDVCLRLSAQMRCSRPSSYASVSEEPELSPNPEEAYVHDYANTKDYCLLNNTFKQSPKRKANSMTQLPHMIRNDLTRQRSGTSSKRHSLISIKSDSILVTHRHMPALKTLQKEHEF
jgi:hypothetical protein